MKQFCIDAQRILDDSSSAEYAVNYVRLKIEFFHKYQNGLICSMWHGTDWFKNILTALDGIDIKEPVGEYKKNFEKLIKTYEAANYNNERDISN